jgi:putative membrane protein
MIAVALAGAAPAMAQSAHQTIPPLSSGRMVATPLSTQVFVSRVEDSAAFEVQAARLAVEKTQNPALKQLADRIIRDHTTADDELRKTIDGDFSAEFPNGAPMPKETALKLKQLQDAWGRDFEAKFVEIMTDGHKKDADLFRYYDANGSDPAIKVFARRTLPIIESHLRDLEALQKAAKSS